MNNLGLTAIVFQFIAALACIGLGIYYSVIKSDGLQIAVFFVVGAACLINAVRMLIKYLKDKRDGK